MRKPNENLDDYTVKPALTETDPPRAVSVGLTGEVEVLKPLTREKVRAMNVFRRRSKGRYQPLWFRRFIAVGSGAVAMLGLVLVSAILMGINDPGAELDIATQIEPDDKLIQPEEPFTFEILSPSSVATLKGGINFVRATAKRKILRPRIQLAQRPRPYVAPLPEEPKFVPTTLVIYSDNGVIKTRIEPWIQSS